MLMRCEYCHKPLGEASFEFWRNAYTAMLFSGRKGAFCNELCYKQYLQQHLVENYNGAPIYWVLINGEKYYVPYPGCLYAFKTIQECRNRIDAKGVAQFVDIEKLLGL